MSRGLALLAAGVWLGLLAASWAVATVNFRMVDRVLGPGGSPEAASRLQPLPEADRRSVLRHLAAEVNRWMFRWWSVAQLALGVVALAALWPGGGAARWVAALALALVLAQALGLAPAIASLGRPLDFAPRPLAPDVARRFGLLHAAYMAADVLKAGLLGVLSLLLIRR